MAFTSGCAKGRDAGDFATPHRQDEGGGGTWIIKKMNSTGVEDHILDVEHLSMYFTTKQRKKSLQ